MNADDARLRALVDYMALELDGIEKRKIGRAHV